jgi:amidase
VDIDDLLWEDGLTQAAMVRSRAVSATELIEATIARIDRVDPLLNCVVTPLYEQAVATASGTSSGPLAGVPILLKDYLATYGGARHTGGSVFLRDHVAQRDSDLVVQFKRAGLIPVGITNTPELALVSTTEPVLHGATLNPWDRGRSPGGSSGASAAAVAAGLAPIGHGNDSAGSLRIPASCCGVFGLKPTRGRNSPGDTAGGIWAEHVMTRSVRDSAAVLGATAGRPFATEAGVDPGRLRIAVGERPLSGEEVHPDCVAAVRETAKLCTELGHEVVEDAPSVDGPALEADFFALYVESAAATVAQWRDWMGRDPAPDELEPLSWAVWEAGQRRTADERLLGLRRLQRAARSVAAFLDEYDLWLTPTLAEPPAPIGYFDASPENPLAVLDLDARFSPFTWLANVTGQPAMSLPLRWNDEGLPIGSHFIARHGEEPVLFSLAAQLERARPWAHRRPPTNRGERP